MPADSLDWTNLLFTDFGKDFKCLIMELSGFGLFIEIDKSVYCSVTCCVSVISNKQDPD